jgi:hypothetical protein
LRAVSIVLACLALLALDAGRATAAQLSVVQTVKAAPGLISDAALQSDGVLYLCYPEAGRIAQYGPDGKLLQDIIREAGIAKRFRPTTCVLTSGAKLPSGNAVANALHQARGQTPSSGGQALQVFDEAEHQVWLIGSDGNTASGIDLAYPSPGGALALSRIGQLLRGTDGLLWALLPDRGALCSFDGKGNLQQQLDLNKLLPYPAAAYSRAQFLDDGSLYVLDYNQGAVLYRRGTDAAFRRLAVDKTAGLDGAPAVQDFAADEQGNVLLLTAADSQPALLLTPSAKGYVTHALRLPLGRGPQRLGCRYQSGRFIIWNRDSGVVLLCELQ